MQDWLAVGVLLLLVTAAILTSMAKSHQEETREVPKPPVFRREFRTVELSDAFEPDTAYLWEPQIEVLQRVDDAGPGGLDFELLRPAHAELTRRYPELYEGSDLESWLEAMERAELIDWRESTVRLTSAGRAFLKCRLAVTV